MQNPWKAWGISLTLLSLFSLGVRAQGPLGINPGGPTAPSVPGGGTPGTTAAPTAPGTVPAGPVAPAAPQKNLWAFLCPTPAMKAACKARFCASQFGQLLNNSLAAPSAFTGGVIPQCCPGPNDPNLNDLNLPHDGALGAAAVIKQDEANALARRAAVRYLGTVDCNWWPEATAALVNSLRADKNECVRLEAAMSLNRGCCCNKATIYALALTVSGSFEDGNPPEDSQRVKAAAAVALDHCLSCFVNIVPAPLAPPSATVILPPPTPVTPVVPREPREAPLPGEEPLPPPRPAAGPEISRGTSAATRALLPTSAAAVTDPRLRTLVFYQRVDALPMDRIVQYARNVSHKAHAAAAAPALPTGSHTLLDVFHTALEPVKSPALKPVPSAAPAPLATSAPPPLPSAAPLPHATSAPPPLPSAAPLPHATSAPPPPVRQPLAVSPPPVPNAEKGSTSLGLPIRSSNLPSSPGVASVVSPPLAPPAPPRPPLAARPQSITAPANPPGSPSSGEGFRPSNLQCLLLLTQSPYPESRVYAVENMGLTREPITPELVTELVRAAGLDSSSLVRAACVRSIRRLQVVHASLPQIVNQLQGDSDPRVRQAVKDLQQWMQSR